MQRKYLIISIVLLLTTLYLNMVCLAETRELHLAGTINNKFKIHMSIRIYENQVNGEYYYDTYKEPIYIYGHIDGSNIVLHENGYPGGIGEFRGNFVTSQKIEGIWTYYLYQYKKYKFSLETYEEKVADQDQENALNVKFIGYTLIANGNEKKVSISLKKDLNAAGEYNCELIYQTFKNDNYYLLIEGSGSTLTHSSPTGQAGCGYEFNLVWLHLDRDLNIIKRQSLLYNSYSGAECHDKQINKDKITLTVNDQKYRYDRNSPENGMIMIN